MVTREEVAKYAKVSVGTVSNVINNKPFVNAGAVEKVRNAIKALNYTPDQAAKSLAGKKTNHIGVAIYEMTNPFHAEVVHGLEEYAAQKGYIVSTFFLNNNAERKLDEICERRLQGLVNFMTNDLPRSFVDILKSHKVVLMNFHEDDSFIFINDCENAMKQYFELLTAQGHKKIAYISTADALRFAADSRGKAYLEGMRTLGYRDELVIYNERYDLTSQAIGYSACKQLLERNADVTAIFATNDLAAMGVIRALSDCGKRCPEDMAVIGCDNIALGEVYVPSISTISVDSYEYGRAIGKAIIDRIEKPADNPYRKIVMKAEAVIRESSAKEI